LGEPILEVSGLVKQFPGVRAVDGVSFAVAPGTCFGLLGPNGAGKTTVIEAIEGITRPDAGEILYKGAPVGARFREEAGIQFQSTELLAKLTVRETLQTFSRLYASGADLSELVELTLLSDIIDRDNARLSGGQKQRLLLAVALVNDPELVFLDEPTTGLDPQARRHVWKIVESIKARGKTVLLTTHYMDEAQFLCEDIAIMDRGRIIARGAPDDLLAEHLSGATIFLPADAVKGSPEGLFEGRNVRSECSFRTSRKGWSITTTRINECLKVLLEAGVDLNAMTLRSPGLEDLFLRLTGKEMRE